VDNHHATLAPDVFVVEQGAAVSLVPESPDDDAAAAAAAITTTTADGELWDDENIRWNDDDVDPDSGNPIQNHQSSNSCCNSASKAKKQGRFRKQASPLLHPLSKRSIPAWRFWKKNDEEHCDTSKNDNNIDLSIDCSPNRKQIRSITDRGECSTVSTPAATLPQHHDANITAVAGVVNDDDDVNANSYVRMESTTEDENNIYHHSTKKQYDGDDDHQKNNGTFPNWSTLLKWPWKEPWKSNFFHPSKQVTCCWIGMSMSALVVTVVLAITVAVLVPAMLYYNPRSNRQHNIVDPNSIFSTTRRAAFLGNSVTFVNDLPRFMEQLSGNSIQQSSCLHSSLNFGTLLQKGNGMYNKWRTENAIIDYYNNDDNENDDKIPVYDFGACTVQQLLLGYDSSLSSNGNNNGNNNNNKNRLNPCYRDSNYLDYINDHQNKELLKRSKKWDYVIMNDQTLYPGTVEKREKSINALSSTYAEYLIASKATPVFIVTYGYSKAAANSDDDGSSDDDAVDNYNALGDIPEFTSRIYYGYQQYQETLKDILPYRQQPLLAPVGLAFLVIYEENYDLWLELFYDDGFHPSPLGTFLMGCCLYATMFGRIPPKLPKSDDDVMSLFGNARMMHSSSMGDDKSFPTAEEAEYLAEIAKRVVLEGYIPATLLDSDTVAKMEEEESSGNNNRRGFRW
jgi:hypothetical protein